ncbi:MAG: YraN family protein [Rikenellaceae bacterium]
MTTKQIGEIGEKLAVEYLLREGYTIVERNWADGKGVHCTGEIDIIASRGDSLQELYIVEVKCRSGRNFRGDYSPEGAFTERKASRIMSAVTAYAVQTGFLGRFVFCLVAINLPSDGSIYSLRFYRDIRL